VRAAALFVILAGLLSPGAASAAASPWNDHQVVASRLVAAHPARDGAADSGPPALGIHFRLAPGWHVYWKHPGDAGAPPQVALFAGRGDRTAVPARLLFPAPQRFRLPGGLVALGYAGEVVYPLEVEPAAAGRPLRAVVDYVACAVECIPFRDELALAPGGPDGGERALLAAWEARLPRAAGTAGMRVDLAYRAGAEPELVLALAGAPLAGGAPELFLEPATGVTFGEPRLSATAGSARFRVPLHAEIEGQLPPALRIAWTVTRLRGQGGSLAVEGVAAVPRSTTGARAAHGAAPRRQSLLLALLALPLLAAALALWLAPGAIALALRGRGQAPPLQQRIQALGFVAAAALVWIAYRLALVLPAARLAGVEVSWLLVALAVRSASERSSFGRGVWLLLAGGAAAFGLWLA
jgi:thiol:disulfide interchange protein DsbD